MAASRRKFQTIDEYILQFPRNVRDILEQLRQAIKESAPEAEETVSYQMPAFRLNGILVWFSGLGTTSDSTRKSRQLKRLKKSCTSTE